MKKRILGLILIFVVIFLIGCSKAETSNVNTKIEDSEVKEEKKEVKTKTKEVKEEKVETFELKTDKKRYNRGSSLTLSFVNNYEKDTKIRLGDGLTLLKSEEGAFVRFGTTKLACECSKECEPKLNTYDVTTKSTIIIPVLFSLKTETCTDGRKGERSLENGVYKAEVEYLERGEVDNWKKLSSNTIIITE